MKKFYTVILLFLLAALAVLPSFAADSEPTVYVASYGSDNAKGGEKSPLKTLYAAFRALPEGGRIVVCGEVPVAATDMPASEGLITITSVGEKDYRRSTGGMGVITMSGNIQFHSAVKFENLDISVAKKDLVFICHGNYTCFGEGLTVTTASGANTPGITAGGYGATEVDSSYLEICSGTWNRIRGGARGTSSAAQTGSATIVIRGGDFNSTFDCGGDSATDGDTYLFIYGGTFRASVNGASAAETKGNVYISIYGGTLGGNVLAGRGGAVGGSVTFNVLTDLSKTFAAGSSKVAGDVTCNVIAGSHATGSNMTNHTLTAEEEKAVRAFDELWIESAKASKLPESTSSIFSRNKAPAGSYTVDASMTAGSGDLDGDGRLSVLDVLKTAELVKKGGFDAKADINGDGAVSYKDALRILTAAMTGKSLNGGAGVRGVSSVLSLYGDAAVRENRLTGGYAFGTTAYEAYTLLTNAEIKDDSVVGLYFACNGTSDPEKLNGYYFEVNVQNGTAAVYSVTDGAYHLIGKRTVPLYKKNITLAVTYGTSMKKADLYVYSESTVEEPYAVFDLKLTEKGKAVGIYTENAAVTLPHCEGESAVSGGTYVNRLLEEFTDPEVWFENGVYYFYGTQSSTQNSGVKCYSTTDFRKFKDEGFVLKKGDAFGDGTFKAANILYANGYYYLFYMAKSNTLNTSVSAYASASSPLGPFKNADKRPLTGNVDMIGGQPFMDADGQVYLIYVRTTGGNKLYGAKLKLSDGKAELDLSTETLLLAPTEPWENAKSPVVECGYIIRHGDLYYMLYSGGTYNSTYGTGYATAPSPLGPYTKYAHNPVMTSNDQAFGVGAATVFASPDGSEHFIAYLRNTSPTVTRPLLTCMDRIRFVKDPQGGADIIEICGPTVSVQPLPSGLGQTFTGDYQTARFIW